jgi:hypothetical protein
LAGRPAWRECLPDHGEGLRVERCAEPVRLAEVDEPAHADDRREAAADHLVRYREPIPLAASQRGLARTENSQPRVARLQRRDQADNWQPHRAESVGVSGLVSVEVSAMRER